MMNLMTVNKLLSLHMTINTIQQLSQLTSTTINTSTYRYKTGDTCIQKLYKVINDCIDIMSVCYMCIPFINYHIALLRLLYIKLSHYVNISRVEVI